MPAGYPGDYPKGLRIDGLDAEAEGTVVFHCGTKRTDAGIVTNGGRVLSVTGIGSTLREAVDRAYARADAISFEGKFCRRDIAARAFGRG